MNIYVDADVLANWEKRKFDLPAWIAAIGFADFQIAACALIDGAALLTFNSSHFSRVPGLQVITP